MRQSQFVHYKTGIELVDREHWSLILLVDTITEAAKSNDESAVRDAMQNLSDALKAHYESEEQVMKSINYPFFEPHAQQHSHTLAAVSSLIRYIGSPSDIKYRLQELILSHIDHYDLHIGEFVRSQQRLSA